MKFECLNLDDIIGFDWDDANRYKNEKKHGLKWTLIEEVFFNKPLIVIEDFKHSNEECRCVALGQSDFGKLITVVFTIRKQKIRVISARSMSKKERGVYAKA